MDVYCSKCAEPWDNDCIHDEVDARHESGDKTATYVKVMREFQSKGCVALSHAYGGGCDGESGDSIRAALVSAAYELLGDDMDGAASTLEDYFYAQGL